MGRTINFLTEVLVALTIVLVVLGGIDIREKHRSPADTGHIRLCAEFDAQIREALDMPSSAPIALATEPARQAAFAGCYGAPARPF